MPEPEIERPVSPLTGMAPAPDLQMHAPVRRNPSPLYYMTLLALIALSVFTLWLYQSKNAMQADVVPNLMPEKEIIQVKEPVKEIVVTTVTQPTVAPKPANVKTFTVVKPVESNAGVRPASVKAVTVAPAPAPRPEIAEVVQPVTLPLVQDELVVEPKPEVVIQPVQQEVVYYPPTQPEVVVDDMVGKPQYNVSREKDIIVAPEPRPVTVDEGYYY